MPEPYSWLDMKFTEHLPDNRVQDVGLNEPSAHVDKYVYVIAVQEIRNSNGAENQEIWSFRP